MIRKTLFISEVRAFTSCVKAVLQQLKHFRQSINAVICELTPFTWSVKPFRSFLKAVMRQLTPFTPSVTAFTYQLKAVTRYNTPLIWSVKAFRLNIICKLVGISCGEVANE